MQNNSLIGRAALAFLALFILFAPARAHASAYVDSLSTMCDDGSFDRKFFQNRNASAQILNSNMVDITNQFPIISASNQCIENIISALQMLPTLADPFGLVTAMISNLIVKLINQACSAVLAGISSVQQMIKQQLTFCMPMPDFNLNLKLNINSGSTACSGGTPFSLISGYSSSGVTGSSPTDFIKMR